MTTEIVNKSTGEAITMPSIATGLNAVLTTTLDVRTNFKAAPFFSLLGENRGDRIELQILNMRIVTAQPDKYKEPARFTQLIAYISFGESKKFMACVVFGGVASEKVEEMVQAMSVIDGGTIPWICNIKLCKATGKESGNEYADIEFSKAKASESDIGSLVEVLQAQPQLLNDFKTMPNEQA